MDEKFEKLFDEILYKYDDKIKRYKEKSKKAIGFVVSLFVFVIILIFIMVLPVINTDIDSKISTSIMLIVIAGYVITTVVIKKYKDNDDIKEKDIRDAIYGYMVKSFNKDYTYNFYGRILSSDYLLVYDKGASRYDSEDLITGILENNYFKVAEVKTEKAFYNRIVSENFRKGYQEGKTYATMFWGVYGELMIKNNFIGTLKIKDKEIGIGKDKMEELSVKVDYKDFERKFSVYTDNKDASEMILNNTMLDKLLDLQNESNYKIEIFIKENKMSFRIHTESFLEFGLLLDEDRMKNNMYRDYKCLEITFKLLEVLNEMSKCI